MSACDPAADPSDTMPVGAAESGESGADPEDETGTGDEAPDAEGSGGQDGIADPAACDQPDNAGLGAVDFDPGDWPVDTADLEFGSADLSGSCEVTALGQEAGVLTAEMSCTVEDSGPHMIRLAVGAPDAGTWVIAEGQNVDVRGRLDNSGGGHLAGGDPPPLAYQRYTVRVMRSEDGALLMAGTTGWVGGAFPEALDYVQHPACADAGCGGEIPEAPFQFSIRQEGGAAVIVTGGQRASLSMLDGSALQIDARRAHATEDCHFNSISVGVVRVMP